MLVVLQIKMQVFVVSVLVPLLCVYQSSAQLSATEREEILFAHNHVRSLVSPSATNMRRLVYSDELEGIAQELADRCVFEHSDRAERNSKSPSFTQVGENIYVGGGLPVNYTDIIARQWGFSEEADYDYESNSCTPGRMCGHYTQIVWADTTHVGCGIAKCSSVVNVQLPPGFDADLDLLFCNYGPAGNVIGRLPYEAGISCSACPSDLPECRENLCSPGQAPPTNSQAPPSATTKAPTSPPPIGQLSAVDREEILGAHNHVRSLVSPSATNMRQLVYSEELEDIAQEIADRCVFEHSDRVERNSKSPSFLQVGENIYVSAGLSVNYTDIIARRWGFSEAADYDYESNSCTPGRMCGHYTQIVWADTTHVGCGIAKCSSVENFNSFGLEADLFFCNYGPAGNIIGRQPYEAGASCSACPSDLPMCQENLCSPQLAPPTTTEAPPSSPPTTTETAPPTTEAPSTVTPSTEAPSTEVSSTEVPSTEAPSTEAPSTEAPSTAAQTTTAPSTDAPSTEAPSTEAPSTVVPSTAAPTTAAPSTDVPSTAAPSTEAPSTVAPSTAVPSTAAPSTEAPSTVAPSTEAPSTEASSTEVPSTVARTTMAPSTDASSTEALSTAVPSTEEPSTEASSTTSSQAPPTETTASPSVEPPVRPNEVGTFIGDTPSIDGGRISIRIKFSSSMQSARCSLTGLPNQDCTSGSVVWSLPTNRFRDLVFLVRVQMVRGRAMRMRRNIKIGPPHLCIVNFINDGVTVFTNGTAMLDFTSTGPTSTFLCSMDRGQLLPCFSGKMYPDLHSGTHRIKVVADNCGRNRRNAVLKFNI